MKKLRHSYDSKDGIPVELVDFYVEKNGKWVLQSEDSDAALATLEKERESRTKLERELAEIRKKVEAVKDIDPEKYAQLVELQEDLERKKAEAKGEYEKLSEIEKRKWAKREEELQKSAAESDAFIEQLLVSQAITLKLTGKVQTPVVLEAVEALLRSKYKPTVIKDGADRKAVASVDGVQVDLAKTLDDWLSGDEAKEFLRAENNSGGGSIGGKPVRTAPASGADAMKLSPVERLKEARRKKAS